MLSDYTTHTRVDEVNQNSLTTMYIKPNKQIVINEHTLMPELLVVLGGRAVN